MKTTLLGIAWISVSLGMVAYLKEISIGFGLVEWMVLGILHLASCVVFSQYFCAYLKCFQEEKIVANERPNHHQENSGHSQGIKI